MPVTRPAGVAPQSVGPSRYRRSPEPRREERLMTTEDDEEPRTTVAERTTDTSTQRALFSYLTADAADEYIAIMRLFAGTLLTDLSAEEVAKQLAERELPLDPDTVESRCRQ